MRTIATSFNPIFLPIFFCRLIKKLYLCSKMSCTSMQITQVCRNQNSCQLITSFLNFPHKLFILSGL